MDFKAAEDESLDILERKKFFFASRKKWTQFWNLWRKLDKPWIMRWNSKTDTWSLPKKEVANRAFANRKATASIIETLSKTAQSVAKQL